MSQLSSTIPIRTGSIKEDGETMADLVNDMRSASNLTLLRTAEEIVRNKIAGSKLLDNATEERVPKLDIHDLKLGRVIGRGAFCCVHEVRSFGSAMSIGTRQSSSGRDSVSRMFRNPFSSRRPDGRDSSTVHSFGNESDLMSNFSGHAREDNVIVDTGGDFSAFDRSRKYVVKQLDTESMDKINFLKGAI
jgi:hypothetical protein